MSQYKQPTTNVFNSRTWGKRGKMDQCYRVWTYISLWNGKLLFFTQLTLVFSYMQHSGPSKGEAERAVAPGLRESQICFKVLKSNCLISKFIIIKQLNTVASLWKGITKLTLKQKQINIKTVNTRLAKLTDVVIAPTFQSTATFRIGLLLLTLSYPLYLINNYSSVRSLLY